MTDITAKPEYTKPVDCGFEYFGGRPKVACVWVGDKYGVEYVLRLYDAVAANLDMEYEFVCFTDHPPQDWFQPREGAINYEIQYDGFPHWWAKLEMFNYRNWEPQDRILYLDLDVVVTGDLRDFFMADHHFTMIANFGVNYQHAKYNSSVMVWNGQGPAAKVYDDFKNNDPDRIMKALHGDQCFIWRSRVDDIRTWPKGMCVSYKYDVRRTGLDNGTRIVVFHGDPKPDVVKDQFVIDNWLRNAKG